MDDDSIRVQLVRIEGKLDVSNEKLETANRINNERHEVVKQRLTLIDTRLDAHDASITGLEKRESVRAARTTGIVDTSKAFLVLAGAIPVAALAALLRMFGA